MLLTKYAAENALADARKANPGPWVAHSRYVAVACENIAGKCPGLDPYTAYIYGLLHAIGRCAGVTSEKHLIDGYRYCMTRGWEKPAQICISHAFMVKDISSSIGVFDMPDGDKDFLARFVKDAVYRHPATLDRWRAVLEIRDHFEKIMGCSIYDCLPGVVENSFRS